MRIILSLFTLFLLTISVNAQQEITLEDIWKNYKYYAKSVPGFNFMNDGKHYTRLEDQVIKKYDLTSGKVVGDILVAANLKDKAGFGGEISSYSFSGDESKIIIESERESIYRRSSKAYFHIYDLKSKELTPIYEFEKVQYVTLSPDNKKVAYVWQNDLYWMDLESGITEPITEDGKQNEIINGATDWVYEEEFGFAKAFFWSPDSKKVAYIKFDESAVKEFTMTLYKNELYPEYETFKYPKVGEKNAEVSVHMFDLTGKTTQVDMGDMTEMYVPRIKWTNKADKLCVFKMNRHQNHLQLLLAGAKGDTKLLLEEKNEYYIDITDNLTFFHDMKGKEKKALTKGKFDVTNFYGVDETNGTAYYQAAQKSAMGREVYKVDLKSGKSKLMTYKDGTNSAQFSSTYDYFVWRNSNINTPNSFEVFDKDLKLVRSIETNGKLKTTQKSVGAAGVEFFDFKTGNGDELNGWMMKPKDFDASKKYPVFMYVYGGPGSQTVTDAWKGNNYWWFQMLAQKGYIVVSVDNRGTGARGEEFKKMTYLTLGKYETIDQIEAAKYLASLDYTDAERIGIFGWSYGGFMASHCITQGADVFKAAIAVAPVTNWKWYDTIYTERYMRTPAENEAGYEDNSPVNYADKLKGAYLLAHGVADDNVHFQNAAEMSNALIAANKQFDTYYYPNRNHGIYGDNARLHLYTKMTNFIMENL